MFHCVFQCFPATHVTCCIATQTGRTAESNEIGQAERGRWRVGSWTFMGWIKRLNGPFRSLSHLSFGPKSIYDPNQYVMTSHDVPGCTGWRHTHASEMSIYIVSRIVHQAFWYFFKDNEWQLAFVSHHWHLNASIESNSMALAFDGGEMPTWMPQLCSHCVHKRERERERTVCNKNHFHRNKWCVDMQRRSKQCWRIAFHLSHCFATCFYC